MAAKIYSRRKAGLKDLPEDERPRERIARLGPGALSNQELVAAILGTGNQTGNVLDIARALLMKYDIRDLSRITVAELKSMLGINDAKACQLVAAVELGKRTAAYAADRKRPIERAGDVAKMFMPGMRGLKKEVLKGLYLDSKLRPLKEDVISIGGLNTNSIEPSDVFRNALIEASAALILVHNHPSGDPAPSRTDIRVTKKLAEAGEILGIRVIDHIIIGDGSYTSLKDSGLF